MRPTGNWRPARTEREVGGFLATGGVAGGRGVAAVASDVVAAEAAAEAPPFLDTMLPGVPLSGIQVGARDGPAAAAVGQSRPSTTRYSREAGGGGGDGGSGGGGGDSSGNKRMPTTAATAAAGARTAVTPYAGAQTCDTLCVSETAAARLRVEGT
ncbi:hypothetical protein I4F81_001365 [Pyropia yezoensis]|uniref:Uncharacterized protein n=1 Tax=Pyropia yezoensis TaxID=2788 RepID=A0ACC3BLC6_PYRYE|nr:hypothetical protein I4F81_001365 [Neopyropia yezoensis]